MTVGLLVRAGVAAALVAGRGGVAPAPPASPASLSPTAVLVATARGEVSVPVRAERGHPALAVTPLERLLPVAAAVGGGWADVRFAGQPFRFLLDAPVLVDGARIVPLAGGAYVAHDTLFVPLQWLTDYIPRRFREAYRYDPLAARFEEATRTTVVRTGPRPGSPSPPAAIAEPARAPNRYGLRASHTVVVDPGHGGRDAGNLGLFLPRGVNEKHITLAIGKRVRDELNERGVRVVMTRSTDEFVPLRERSARCTAECDLFVSIHVDALNRAPGYQRANGVHTFFLGEELTAEARRVAAMENDAMRYERGGPVRLDDPRLYILKDLQLNEVLRESALLAELVQGQASSVHPGRDRGVVQSRFMVLATSRRPAILIETGFATNRRDAQYLASARGQQQLAEAIADGVVQYLRRYEAKTMAEGQ